MKKFSERYSDKTGCNIVSDLDDDLNEADIILSGVMKK